MKTKKFSIKIGQLFTVLLAVIVIILVTYNAYKTYQISYLMLQKIQNETASHIIDMTTQILDISSNNIEILSKVEEENEDILSQQKLYIALMFEKLKAYDFLHSIYIANALGDFIQVRRYPTLEARVVEHKTHKETLFHINHRSKITQIRSQYNSFSPLNRLWYTLVEEQNKISWSKPYVYATFSEVGITASVGVYKNHQKIKVIGADITYQKFNAFIKKQSLKIDAEIVIFDDKQYIIASSLPLKEEKEKVLTLKNSHYSLLNEAYQSGKRDGVIVDNNGISYLYFFQEFPKTSAQQWYILTLIPQETILGNIKTTMYQTIAISLLIFLIFIAIIAYSSHKISKPIRKISKQIRRIEKLDFKINIEQNSNITEIKEVQSSLQSLQQALNSFSKYIPIELVKQLIELKIEAKIGGEEKPLAFMFTDIENFTTLSETMPPALVAQQLSEYFELLATIIKKNNGTVDKYIGDAVLAFWGAPKEVENPISLAIKTLIEIEHKLENLNAKWEREGMKPFKTRIGVHFGKALVGNIGSTNRLNYTVVGDNVNITARLEALNKAYGTYNIISQTIYEKMKEPYPVRYLDSVLLKGKTKPTKFYTLII